MMSLSQIKKNKLEHTVDVSKDLDKSDFFEPESTKNDTAISSAESTNVLIKHTGLTHLRTCYSYNIIYVSMPYCKCYCKFTPETLSIMVSSIFFKLALPAKFMSSIYLDSVVRCALLHPEVSYLGHPQEDIDVHLVAVSNGVLDLNTGVLIDPSPELFVVSFLPYPLYAYT